MYNNYISHKMNLMSLKQEQSNCDGDKYDKNGNDNCQDDCVGLPIHPGGYGPVPQRKRALKFNF